MLFVSYVALHSINSRSVLTLAEFLNELTEWDCNNYYRISGHGYNYWIENGYKTTLVFFPLYPFISYLLNFIIQNTRLSLLIVSIISYAIGCCYLYALVAKEYNKNIASKTVMYISVFPYSFFFGTMMPESLFFLLICATFYYINEHKWCIASILGVLATTTRLQGILIIIPFVLELIEHYNILSLIKEKKWRTLKSPLLKLLYLPIYFVGIIIYLLCNYIYGGDPFYFLELQEKIWTHSLDHPATALCAIINQIKAIKADPTSTQYYNIYLTWLPQIIIFVSVIVLLIYGIKYHKVKYTFYLLVYFIISFAADFVLSGGRYMSVAFPLFIIRACITNKRPFIDKCFTLGSFSLNILFNISYIYSACIV